LGVWLIASPWILGFAQTRAMHFSIVVGLAITFLAALELFLLYDADRATRAEPPSRIKRSHVGGKMALEPCVFARLQLLIG
jgi:hypothetical protein